MRSKKNKHSPNVANITLLSFQTPALETLINPNTQQNISYKWFMGVCSKQIVVLQRLFRALALVQSDLEHQLFTSKFDVAQLPCYSFYNKSA